MTHEHRQKALTVALCIVAVLALVGYLVGTGGTTRAMASLTVERWRAPAQAPTIHAPLAPRYSQMAEQRLSPNADFVSQLERLRIAWRPPATAPAQASTEAALDDRARNRAFAGAPPTVPHPIDQRDAASCLACHQHGIAVGSRIASPLSHQPFASCTQCHVGPPPRPLDEGEAPANAFVRAAEPAGGARAWPGAPPQVPHTTWLREDCRSCHGPAGHPGLRTTHPERAECLQCHAPSAALDQRELAPPDVPPAEAP